MQRQRGSRLPTGLHADSTSKLNPLLPDFFPPGLLCLHGMYFYLWGRGPGSLGGDCMSLRLGSTQRPLPALLGQRSNASEQQGPSWH